MEFDMIGADPSLVNAIRRVCIAEVPTMAPEEVYILDNSSIVADEVLSHRLGLIPIGVDPRDFEYSGEEHTSLNTIVFRLNVKCRRNPDTGAIENESGKFRLVLWINPCLTICQLPLDTSNGSLRETRWSVMQTIPLSLSRTIL